jgi:hypothetical protein
MYRMGIPEPKVEHHEGRGIRICLIFPEMRPILDSTSAPRQRLGLATIVPFDAS